MPVIKHFINMLNAPLNEEKNAVETLHQLAGAGLHKKKIAG